MLKNDQNSHCMRQTKHLHAEEKFGESELLERVHAKVDEIDWELAKSDVAVFIPDKQRIAIWSASFFHDLVGHLRVVDTPNSTKLKGNHSKPLRFQ